MIKILNDIKTLINFIRSDRRMLLITMALIITVIIILAGKMDGPKPKDAVITNKDNYTVKTEKQIIWEETETVPGITDYAEIKDDVPGKFLGNEKSGSLTLHKYTNLEAFHDTTEVATDSKGTIKYVFITTNPYEKLDLSLYVTKYNLDEPDIVKEIKELSNHEAYVYLDKGFMLYVGNETKLVYAEIYFEPMNESTFERFWGNKLTEEFSYPNDAMVQ